MINPIPPEDELALRKQAARRRRQKAIESRTCRCGAHFTKLSDKLVHITTECELRGQPRLRNVSCHRCATEIDINTTRTCKCGFTLPETAVNPL